MKVYDALVIGSGPAGLTAGLYLARFGLSLAMVEKITHGGLLLQTADIENYPGRPKVQGYELADAMQAQLAAYPHDSYRGEVSAFEHAPGKNRVKVGAEWLEAKTVIIASGVRYRKLGLPNEEGYLGKGLSHCALCDGNFFRGQVVAVVGGGNSALEESLYLSRIVKELHIIHRREGFRADKIYQEKIAATPNIHLHTSRVVKGLNGDVEGAGLTGLTLAATNGQPDEQLEVSGLFIFTGFEPQVEFLPAELQRDPSGFVVTDTEMRCNLPGVFAAGDIRAKNCRQIITAAGDGATAANSAHAYLEQAHA